MSGIFIKDMWMPDHCGKCPLALLNGYGERRCFVTDSNITDNATWAEDRPGDCPMREIELESEEYDMNEPIKMRGRLLLFDRFDSLGIVFPKDCEITYPEKLPIVYEFKFYEPDMVLGTATVYKDEKGFICEADINNSTTIKMLDELNGELPIGGYFRKVKRNGSKIESAELVGIGVTFGPALEEYKMTVVKKK